MDGTQQLLSLYFYEQELHIRTTSLFVMDCACAIHFKATSTK
jgi:hypothetical protein